MLQMCRCEVYYIEKHFMYQLHRFAWRKEEISMLPLIITKIEDADHKRFMEALPAYVSHREKMDGQRG